MVRMLEAGYEEKLRSIQAEGRKSVSCKKSGTCN